MKASHTILGMAGAAAVGALIGVLFAPDKGTNTRKKIAEKGKGCADDFKGKLDDIVHKLSENGKDLLTAGKEKYNEMKTEVHHGINDAASEIKNAANKA